jgi:hypothetical protein
MKKTVKRCMVGVLVATAALSAAIRQTSAEVVVRGGKEGEPESEIRKAPAYVYPDFHTVAAQPSPSEVNPSFFGPVLLMKSAAVDLEPGTATVPLRRGKMKSGEDVWFILTDASDENIAPARRELFAKDGVRGHPECIPACDDRKGWYMDL